jgi:SAM-dependent methyltransferase
VPEQFDKDFWEARYDGHGASHRREPNPQLVAEVGDLEPGVALDAGCGEGAEAIWLAERGWRVTAVDIAAGALGRARGHAESLDREVAGRIQWRQEDLDTWVPEENRFDLVTSLYVHSAGSRQELFGRLAAAVAPGGTLLVLAHDPADVHDGGAHAPSPQSTVAFEEVVGTLEVEKWDVVVAETRTRTAADGHGHEVTMREAVVRARRRG